jgi:hypothetical protein
VILLSLTVSGRSSIIPIQISAKNGNGQKERSILNESSKLFIEVSVYKILILFIFLKLNSSIIPRWEELVVFNEEFRHFIKEKPNVLVLFELLDTHKPLEEEGDSRHNYLSEDTSKKWQRIAWAFLKVRRFLSDFMNINLFLLKHHFILI